MRTARPFLLAALALAFLFHADATAKPATAKVPRLVGLRVFEAERRLLDPGLTARLIGKPNGEGTRIVTAQRPAAGERPLLVAGGTGIASVYELARALAPDQVGVLLGARRAADLMGAEDFAALGVDLRVATEDGSRGRRGLVTELLEEALAEPGPSRLYACGPTPMLRRCAELCAARGVPCSVSLENHMACGFGVCLGCAAPLVAGGYALVCSAGPVFDAADVAWDGLS